MDPGDEASRSELDASLSIGATHIIDEVDRILLTSASLQRKVRENQRFHRYERMLRRIRLRTFDYEDHGKTEKVHRVIGKIKVICGPTWERRAKRIEAERLSRLRWQ